MQSEAFNLLFSEEGDGDYREGKEEPELLKKAVEQLNLVDEEDTEAYDLRGGQQIKLRELRSKGLSFQVWPAAHALCWYLEEMFSHTGMFKTHASHLPMSECSMLKQNMRVLELGSGTGMVGIVCAMLGGNCILTDLPHVTSNLEYNVSLNQEAIHSCGRGGSVVVRSLRWGERSDVEAVGHPFDLVVASDVVYYDHLFEPLLNTLKWLLYPPSIDSVILSSASRTPAKSEEGAAPVTCMATEKLIADVRHTKEDSSLPLPSITKTTASLEEVASAVSNINADTSNGFDLAEGATTVNGLLSAGEATTAHHHISAPISANNAPRSLPLLIREDTNPVCLLAHLRRWKKDSHFFKKASKLFHVTVVHKHFHEANSRTGVPIYLISKRK